MTPLAAAFVILLTFATGPSHVASRQQIIQCRDQACVENVLTHAPESRALSRLRVFRAEDYGNGSKPLFAPLQDLTFD